MALMPSEFEDDRVYYSHTASITAGTSATYRPIYSTTVAKAGLYIIIGNSYSNFSDAAVACVTQLILNGSQIAIGRSSYLFGGGANVMIMVLIPANSSLEIRGWDPGTHNGGVIYGFLNYYRLGD